jgi:hypothetical protein
MFRVKDGDRTLEFEGEHLAHSSSRKPESDRWVEFDLYRTERGTYILSRVGQSVVYHAIDCFVVRRHKQSSAPVAVLTEDSVPCTECVPTTSLDNANETVYPERAIHWAMSYQDAESVVEALAKYDDGGNRYFTHVSRALLRDASDHDPNLRASYLTERIL